MRALDGGNRSAWWGRWQQLRNALLDLILPPRCAGCGQSGNSWCPACHASVKPIHDPVCPRCGRPQRDTRLCLSCSQGSHDIDGIRSAVLFEGPLREAIHHLKYSGRISLAEPLGQFLGARWQSGPMPADMLVPVPLHAARLRERGYNQSALLAQQLSRSSGLPLVENAMRRVRATSPQVTLNAAERKANVHGAFEAYADWVQGQRVLLIDDICTTGATLEACSHALKQAGAKSVWALTLARAP